MAVTISGVSVASTKSEQRTKINRRILGAINKIRSGTAITNRHEMLAIGQALNAMTDAGRRQFAYDVLGTTNRYAWERAWKASRVYPARVWAARVENMSIRLKRKQGPPAAGTAARVAWDWMMRQLNRI